MLERISEIFADPQTDGLEKVYELINSKLESGASFMEAYDDMFDNAPAVAKIWDSFNEELRDRLSDEIEDQEEFSDTVTEVLEEFCDSYSNDL